MATTPIHPNNGVNIARATITGSTTHYFALDHNKDTSINVTKAAETVTISVTNDIFDAAGLKITDLEDAGIVWNARSADAVDYLAGDSTGLTGVKLTVSGNVSTANYSIIQYSPR